MLKSSHPRVVSIVVVLRSPKPLAGVRFLHHPQDLKMKTKVKQFDTYLATIKNSIGSQIFKNLYFEVENEKKDITEDGWLSCAFYVSSILYLSKYIKNIHATVSGTITDLEDSGWKQVDEPEMGSILIWVKKNGANRHRHIGFYVGNKEAISNDSNLKYPIKHNWKYNDNRELEMILWNPKIKNS